MIFDIIFLIIFIWAAFKGFSKGLIYQLASLTALVLGIFGAVKLSELLTQVLISKFNMSGEYLPLISFALIFIVIIILVHLLGKILEKIVDAIALGFVNRLTGAVFNSIKAAFIISILLVFLNTINAQSRFLPQDQINNSIMYKPLSKLAPAIFPYLKFVDTKEIIEKPLPPEYDV
jgi:membrane protein required for colicin V production